MPGYSISTPYGISGSHWTGCGFHTGCDVAAPRGTTIVAPIAGTIRHRNYGSAFGPYQFAISPSVGQPFAEDEFFVAHCLSRLPDGTEVQVNQPISEVGDLGNATGPHGHFEYHVGCKNCWKCNNMANPQPIFDHQSGSSGGGGGSTYPPPTSNTVYVSKLVQGQMESDSVWYLQRSLNQNGNPSEGANLPLTGNFLDQTAEAVKKCQQAHGFGDDPMGSVYVGPSQAAHLFDGWGLEIIYDTGNPNPPDPEPGPPDQEKPPAPSLMLPGATWQPITNFPGLRPFVGTAKKITTHTTQTSVLPNWEQQQSGIPHLSVDLATGERWQHLDFSIAAYTLNGGDHSPNSDSGQNIQIEIIGYAADSPNWPQSEYDELASILHWLCDNLGIPYNFPVPFPPASRLNWEQWEPLSGILGHSMAPFNDHTDPGALDVSKLTGSEPEPEPGPPESAADDELRAILVGGLNEIQQVLANMVQQIEALE